MRAGRRRCYLALEQFAGLEDELSGDRDLDNDALWTPETYCWGNVEASSVRKDVEAARVQASADAVVTVDYVAGVDATKRWRYGSRILNIVGVMDPGERHAELVCLCKERR